MLFSLGRQFYRFNLYIHIYIYIYIYICYIVICRYMLNESQPHKGRAKNFFKKICTSHFIVRVRKGYSRFACERELETEHNCNILTPILIAVSVVSFSFSRAAQPEAKRPTLLAFSTTSYQQLLWTPTHLGPNSIGGLEGPFRPGVAFPTTFRLLLQLSDFLS